MSVEETSWSAHLAVFYSPCMVGLVRALGFRLEGRTRRGKIIEAWV